MEFLLASRIGFWTWTRMDNFLKIFLPRIQPVVFYLEEDLLEKEEEYLRLLRGDLDLLDPLLLLLDPLE